MTGRVLEKITDDSMHKAFGNYTDKTKVEVFNWNKKLGPIGEFMRIPKEDLNLDLSYQREPDSLARIKEIAKNFEWALLGSLIVSYNDDGYYVVDGGHRLRAAFRRDDVKDIPCIVFCFDDPRDEARLFYYYNNKRKNVSTFDNHKAAMRGEGRFYESEIAIKTEKLVKKYGYTVTRRAVSEFTTASVKSIGSAIIKNEKIAENTFSFLAKIAGGIPISSKEFKGLFYLMQMNPAVDFFDFPLKNVINAGHDQLMDQIKRDSLIEKKGGEKSFARSIARIINKGQIKNKVAIPE